MPLSLPYDLPPEQMQELLRRIQNDCQPLYNAMAQIYARSGASIIIIKGEPIDKIIMEPKLTLEQQLVIDQLKDEAERVTQLHVDHYFGRAR